MTATEMNRYEKVGRWLCILFYRDAPKLLQSIGEAGIKEIFEGLEQIDPAYFELLAGGYRFAQFRMVKRGSGKGSQGIAGVKWNRLGEVVRKGQRSIDGLGEVRAREVLLYIEVGERFERWLKREEAGT